MSGVDLDPELDRRGVIIGLGLAVGGLLSHLNMPQAVAAPIPEAEFERMIPDSVGRWQSRKSAEVVMPALDESSDRLYENLVTRVYQGEGLPAIMMLLAYSSVQQNDVQVHRPEVCYPASGFPILSTKPVALRLGADRVDGLQLVADRGGLKEEIIYWIRVGRDFPLGWAEQRMSIAISNFRGATPDGLLFRVSTIEDAPFYSPAALKEFVQAFVGASPAQFRKKILF